MFGEHQSESPKLASPWVSAHHLLNGKSASLTSPGSSPAAASPSSFLASPPSQSYTPSSLRHLSASSSSFLSTATTTSDSSSDVEDDEDEEDGAVGSGDEGVDDDLARLIKRAKLRNNRGGEGEGTKGIGNDLSVESEGGALKLKAEVDERGHIEYKLKLIAPTPDRFERLVTQLKWRLFEGGGEAIYEIGVLDDGTLIGLSRSDMLASISTLERMAGELGATVVVQREIVLPPQSTQLNDDEDGEDLVDKSKYRKRNCDERQISKEMRRERRRLKDEKERLSAAAASASNSAGCRASGEQEEMFLFGDEDEAEWIKEAQQATSVPSKGLLPPSAHEVSTGSKLNSKPSTSSKRHHNDAAKQSLNSPFSSSFDDFSLPPSLNDIAFKKSPSNPPIPSSPSPSIATVIDTVSTISMGSPQPKPLPVKLKKQSQHRDPFTNPKKKAKNLLATSASSDDDGLSHSLQSVFSLENDASSVSLSDPQEKKTKELTKKQKAQEVKAAAKRARRDAMRAEIEQQNLAVFEMDDEDDAMFGGNSNLDALAVGGLDNHDIFLPPPPTKPISVASKTHPFILQTLVEGTVSGTVDNNPLISPSQKTVSHPPTPTISSTSLSQQQPTNDISPQPSPLLLPYRPASSMLPSSSMVKDRKGSSSGARPSGLTSMGRERIIVEALVLRKDSDGFLNFKIDD